MKPTPHSTAGLAVDSYTSPVQMNRIASPNGRPQRTMPLLRKYEVAHLTPSLTIQEHSIMAPALPVFENAFATFAHGTLLTTQTGLIAVEDLLPGDQIKTKEYGFQSLLWHGAMTVTPTAPNGLPAQLVRIAAGAECYGASGPDLVLGPAARVRITTPYGEMLTGSRDVFIPAADRIDGQRFIGLAPRSAVQVYQIGFARHCSVVINGHEIETLHPGPMHDLQLRPAMLDQYLSLFGHVRTLADFGPMCAPRLRQADLDLAAA